MDRASDKWKRIPLAVAGELPFQLPEALLLAPSSIELPESPSINNYYVIVAVPPASLGSTLARLEEAAVSPDQWIVFIPSDFSFLHPRQEFLGLLEQIEGESADEFCARLLVRLEAQRQKKLSFALLAAQESGATRKFSDTELAQILDITRIAHALACGHGLTPLSHGNVLRHCLEGTVPPGSWASDTPLEKLIVDAAALIFEHAAHGGNFREVMKERAATLPFRVRTDLFHQIENCFGLLLGGKNHAA